jgi:hypothetical protein
MVPTGVSRERKRTRAAPSDRSPSRWQRARSPLSTGCPGPFHAQPPSSRICAAGPCGPDEPVGPAREPGAGLSSNIPRIAAMSTTNLGLDATQRKSSATLRSQLMEMFAARRDRRESTAGLLGPPAVICRFCPVRAAVIIGSPRKFGPWPTCTPWFRGMDHPTWRHDPDAPVSAADAALPLRR